MKFQACLAVALEVSRTPGRQLPVYVTLWRTYGFNSRSDSPTNVWTDPAYLQSKGYVILATVHPAPDTRWVPDALLPSKGVGG